MKPIHPFPARMAPELSRDLLMALPPGSRIIDPMCGSGTVVRQAVEAGHDCVGRDLDPLAVLMARAWVSRIEPFRLIHDGHEIIARAQSLRSGDVVMPWDDETANFARYWFASPQLDALARLSIALKVSRFRTRDLLRVAFSRLIITKDRGASLARDVSHSRPHRIATNSDFDVYGGFLKAARLIADRLDPGAIHGCGTVRVGDARQLAREGAGEFDAAMTSPPYLNAIDYIRGHRLTLIWFGYLLNELQALRARLVGSERALATAPVDISTFIDPMVDKPLAARYVGWVRRYASDIRDLLEGMREVVRPGGNVVIVVGNSMIRGADVDNAGIIRRCAVDVGLEFVRSVERAIPARRRYLPPPTEGSALAHRMRSECVLTLRVPDRSSTADGATLTKRPVL